MTFIQDKIRVLTCQKGGRGNIISWVSFKAAKIIYSKNLLLALVLPTTLPTYLLLILLHFVSTRIYGMTSCFFQNNVIKIIREL